LNPFRAEDLIYEKVLREEYGIKTKLDVYPGPLHIYWLFFPVEKCRQAQRSHGCRHGLALGEDAQFEKR
jgi:hypothetical protein